MQHMPNTQSRKPTHSEISITGCGSTHSVVVGEQGDWSSSTDTGKVETFSGKVVEEDVCVW